MLNKLVNFHCTLSHQGPAKKARHFTKHFSEKYKRLCLITRFYGIPLTHVLSSYWPKTNYKPWFSKKIWACTYIHEIIHYLHGFLKLLMSIAAVCMLVSPLLRLIITAHVKWSYISQLNNCYNCPVSLSGIFINNMNGHGFNNKAHS